MVTRQGKNLAEPIDSFIFKVSEDDLPARLDHFLARRMPWRSRTFFQGMIARGEVTVNGRPSRPGRYLCVGETVVVDVARYQQKFVSPASIELDILCEDDDLLVLNKAPGIVAHPTGRHLYDTIMNAVHARYAGLDYKPRLVHRLDKETSGVLVLAKSAAARTCLARQIESRLVAKTYRALTHGVFARRTGEIALPLNRSKYSHMRTKQDVVLDGGLPAHSEYNVEATAPYVPGFADGLSLVNVRITTGRTHQIRVHLSATGHPILADKLYGREATCRVGDVYVKTHLLHAWKFACAHPGTGEMVEFVAPLPRVFRECVEEIGFAAKPIYSTVSSQSTTNNQ